MKQRVLIFTILFFCFPLNGMINKLKLRHVRSYRNRLGEQIKMDQLKTDQWVPGVFFKEFPREIDLHILNQIPTNSDDKIGFEKTLRGINSLAQVNKFFNEFINDNQRTLAWIKQLSWQFDIANDDVARKLCTKTAIIRYFSQMMSIGYDNLSFQLRDIRKGYNAGLIDLNFTYVDTKSTMLHKFRNHHNSWTDVNIIPWLIENGADINICDSDGNTICMRLLKNNEASSRFKLFFRHEKLNLNHQNKNGDTMLHICMQKMPLMISSTSDISDEIVYQYKPLCDVVKILLERKANPTIENKYGHTPLKHLLEKKYWENMRNKQDNAKKTIFSDIIPMLEQAEVDFNAQKNMNETSQ